MRSYDDDYIAPSPEGRDVRNGTAIKAHQSAERRSCAVLVASIALMSFSVCGAVVSLLPNLQMFTLWLELRYTVIAFSASAFITGGFFLLSVCMPRRGSLLWFSALSSLLTIGTLGAFCFFLIDRDFTRLAQEWEKRIREDDHEVLCKFQTTVKCVGWHIPCGSLGDGRTGAQVRALYVQADNDTDTTTSVVESTTLTTTSAGTTSAEESTTVSTTTSAPTPTTTTATTATTQHPSRRDLCPVCKEGSINYEWPLCAVEFRKDVEAAMPYIVTFSSVVTVGLLVCIVFAYQVRAKATERQRGALLGNTQGYL